ncbi:hypothetical protein DPMN_056890 [Dreissena polymorpha]|uniref:Uncharacterized protein n=1 Tax=Dreissena polymorpha TaxID=45954 RepID=A0A9D4CU50_DREPO|nr:hypothetical protein DPMN_056890 [Dreissena polymorpha]
MSDKLACAARGELAVCVRGRGGRIEQIGGHDVHAGRTGGGLVVIRSQSGNKQRSNNYL